MYAVTAISSKAVTVLLNNTCFGVYGIIKTHFHWKSSWAREKNKEWNDHAQITIGVELSKYGSTRWMIADQ